MLRLLFVRLGAVPANSRGCRALPGGGGWQLLDEYHARREEITVRSAADDGLLPELCCATAHASLDATNAARAIPQPGRVERDQLLNVGIGVIPLLHKIRKVVLVPGRHSVISELNRNFVN